MQRGCKNYIIGVNLYIRTLNYTYDTYCRLTSVDEIRIDTSYNTRYAYNNKSQIASITYPSGYQVYYEYYPNGTKKNIKDTHGNKLWQTDDINVYGQLLQATTGNGAVTANTYDILTNRLVSSKTSNGIQNFSYTFDGFGNLTSRTDSLYSGKTETFTYDNLDRLTGITMNNLSSSIVYDALGRMTSKEKDGSIVFEYAQFGGTKPHATSSVQTKSQEFPDNQNIIYNSLDKVNRIAQGRKIVTFSYGYDAQRTKMIILDTVSNRTKTKDYVGSCEFVNDNGSKSVYTYLNGPYGVFAVVIKKGAAEEVNYIYKDHLGSWTAITDSVCGIVERRSFDAWGNLRDPQTWSGSPARPPKFDRGFTGHEHIYELGLINMNGRMYDPLMSSFLSPDNYMQDPTTQQGFNRYAYCMYNPLKYVDPSGEQYFGWDPSLEYRMEQEAKGIITNFWHQCYDSGMASHYLTMAMANSLYGHGPETHQNGSGNHGSPGGGGSVEVKPIGNGKYEVVKGLYDGGNTVYIVDDQGNRTGILGYTLTPYTFYDENGIFVENKIIDLNDNSGQDFWDTNTDDLPFKIVYEIDMIFGARGGLWGSAYDFKTFENDVYRAMAVDFGFGSVIATGRDIGNFFAGYLWGFSGTPYIKTRTLFNLFQLGPEPHVSQYAQDFGYFWGLYNLNKHNKKP